MDKKKPIKEKVRRLMAKVMNNFHLFLNPSISFPYKKLSPCFDRCRVSTLLSGQGQGWQISLLCSFIFLTGTFHGTNFQILISRVR